MPRVYMTLAERAEAEYAREARKRDLVLSDDLKTGLKENGLDMKQVAQITGINYRRVSKILKNPNEVKLCEIRKVAFLAKVVV